MGSDATLEEFQSENRQLKDEIATLEEKLQNYKEMLKQSRASYDAAVETLTRTITSHETVAVCLLMEKYEAETTQSKEELMAIEQVQTTLSASARVRTSLCILFLELVRPNAPVVRAAVTEMGCRCWQTTAKRRKVRSRACQREWPS